MIIEKFSNFYTPKEKIVVEAATDTVVENVTTFNDSMQKTATIIGLFESLSADLNLVHKDELESVSKLIIDHVSTNIDNLKIQLKDLSKNDLNLVNENIKILTGKVAGLNEHTNINFEKYSKLVYDTSLSLEKKIKAVETQDLVKEDLSKLAEEVVRIEEGTKQELKKQTKLVYDTASGLDEKIKSIKVIDFSHSINELQNQIDSIQESVNDVNQLQETTSEKYNRLVYDTALTLEQKINDVSSLIDQKVNSIEIPDYSYLEEQIKTVQDTVIDIVSIKPIPDMTDKVVSIEKRLNVVEDKKLNEQKKATSLLKEDILSLESHISSFNDKIQEQNNKYTQLEQSTKQAIAEAKKLLVDDKYVEINRKINFIEQVLEKFNEKTILTEGVLDAPSETKTSDPLTPLNQNFVTFEQLQKHYTLFINRIQQQLTTIGGGGAVLLYDLDDVNYNSVKNANNGDVLTYNSANLKWEAAVSGGGGVEADTLATVTNRGNVTTNGITINNANANFFAVNTAANFTVTTGQIAWNPADLTFDMGMANGVTLQVGQEQYIKVKAGSAISDGQAVMFAGASGEHIIAVPNDVSVPGYIPEWFIGVATQDLAINAFGYITTFGKVHNVNTLAYTVGDILYADPLTVGGLTNTEPVAPYPHIVVAAVTKRAGGDGHILVRPTLRFKISQLSDANITSPASGQVLTYQGNVWFNRNINSANVTELTNLYFTNARATAAVTHSTLSNLTVQGNITVTTGTINAVDVAATGNITSPYFYSQSDINLKKDLVHVTNALNIVNLLDGYWFKWKNNDADSIGLIAQHVESVLPMLIGNSPDGSKTVLYNGIIAILLEAIKEQQVQIDEIKAKLNENI